VRVWFWRVPLLLVLLGDGLGEEAMVGGFGVVGVVKYGVPVGEDI
jgi:hypothetical protein